MSTAVVVTAWMVLTRKNRQESSRMVGGVAGSACRVTMRRDLDVEKNEKCA